MFILTDQENPMMAQKAITVYKTFTYVNKVGIMNHHRDTKLDIDKLYTKEIEFDGNSSFSVPYPCSEEHDEDVYKYYELYHSNPDNYTVIDIGFHSLSEKYTEFGRYVSFVPKVKLQSWVADYFTGGVANIFVKCEIPKGALYYKSTLGIYVSNKLILKEII